MQTKQLTLSPLYIELLKQYLPVLSLAEGAVLLKFPSVNSIRIAFFHGRLPVRLRSIAGRQVFFLSDIVEYLETGIPQEQILLPKSKSHTATPGKKRGRPTKAEQIARRQAATLAGEG